jgi:hypothetical protein
MSGIANADQFLLFLSDQCMSRPFVQNEVREAIKMGRKVRGLLAKQNRCQDLQQPYICHIIEL